MPKDQARLQSNIWKYYIFEVLWPSNLFMPIFQLFMLARNLTITQMALLDIIWTISLMGLEIPSGLLADKWGRKKTLFLSQSFLIISTIIIIFAQTIWVFILSAILSGFWFACYSGTGVAFFYDSLVELNKEEDYEKLWGRMGFITAPIGFILATSASILFVINILLPYILTTVFAFISLFVILTFLEPKFHRPSKEQSIYLHFKGSMKKVSKNEFIAFIVIFGAILGFSLGYLADNLQLYLKSIKIPIIIFGIIYASSSIIDGIGAILANRLKTRFGYRVILTITLSYATVSIFGLSFISNYYGVIVFAFLFFLVGSFRIIQRGYIHKRVESYNRATVDSTSTFIMTIIAIILTPIAGFLADLRSIRLAFFLIGIILVLYTIYYFIVEFNNKQLFD